MEINNGYLLPIFIAFLIIFLHLIFSQKLKYDRRFSNNFSNRLYALSFVKPFVWFVNPNEDDPRVKKEEELIQKAGLDDVLNYRVFTTLKTALFLTTVFVYIILFLFMDQIVAILDFVFRIKEPTGSATLETRLFIGIILLIALLIPNQYVKRRATRNEYYLTQELPVVQLSIILMLRARRPLNEVMYTLGQSQTRYKKIFQKAYRIYTRNKSDCWKYLMREFKGTGFEDTIEALSNMEHYSKDETIRVLENGMHYLVQRSTENKEKGAAFGNLFSQFSMAIPFGGVVLLGAIPFAMYIMDVINVGVIF